jgi:hypothetical protein
MTAIDKETTELVDKRDQEMNQHRKNDRSSFHYSVPSFSISSHIKFPIHPVFPPKTRTRFMSVILGFFAGVSSSDMVDTKSKLLVVKLVPSRLFTVLVQLRCQWHKDDDVVL